VTGSRASKPKPADLPFPRQRTIGARLRGDQASRLLTSGACGLCSLRPEWAPHDVDCARQVRHRLGVDALSRKPAQPCCRTTQSVPLAPTGNFNGTSCPRPPSQAQHTRCVSAALETADSQLIRQMSTVPAADRQTVRALRPRFPTHCRFWRTSDGPCAGRVRLSDELALVRCTRRGDSVITPRSAYNTNSVASTVSTSGAVRISRHRAETLTRAESPLRRVEAHHRRVEPRRPTGPPSS
jgi:hypothetical protein